MKNNKGFTLIELLVVIIILISVSAIALPNVITTLDKHKEQEKNNQYELLISYMEIYDSKHVDSSIYSKMNDCVANVSQIIEFLGLNESKFDKIKTGRIVYSNYSYNKYEESEESIRTCNLYS